MAKDWAIRINELTNGNGDYACFMCYHVGNDDTHMDKLYGLIDRLSVNEQTVDDIVRTVRVVSRLYAMQLEEIDYVDE